MQQAKAGRSTLPLHCLGAFDAKKGERADELAEGDSGSSQQERFPRRIFFCEDVMPMVEVGELLRELEGVLGEIGGLRCADALLQNLRKTPGAQPEGPDVFVLVAAQKLCRAAAV